MLAYPDSLRRHDRRWIAPALWAGMGLSLALCYLGGTWPAMCAGLLLFGGLAALRPDLAVLFVPLTAPLFLTPIVLPTSGRQIALPPHELALLVTAAAALPSILAERMRDRETASATRYPGMGRFGRAAAGYAPEALLQIAGLAAVGMALPEPEAHADALRAFRWFIAEPLIFAALIRCRALWPSAKTGTGALVLAQRLLDVFVLGGTAVALVGLLQFVGYLLHAHLEPASFASGDGVLGGIRRVTSVYGNPNNLALYLGRVWPLAAALALADQERRTKGQRWHLLVFGLSSLVCLGAIVVSFSRGAWMGAGAASMVLMLPAARRRLGGRLLPGILLAVTVVVGVGALIYALRGGPMGGSANVRILLWQESLKLLERHPLGVGLDQFFYYHHPAYGRSRIDPSLANTQERYARQPHNLLFEIWLNLGPPGLVAFVWLLVRCLRRARSTLRFPHSAESTLLTRGILAALAATLIHGLVDSFYFWPDIAIAFWLLLVVHELIGHSSRSHAPQLRYNRVVSSYNQKDPAHDRRPAYTARSAAQNYHRGGPASLSGVDCDSEGAA
ncbi:MAG TPA: O-antigen ligase family protein [Roseiflexaceae bacterium]|nr:O-antigen ligase family protein [Roseiflexaceae bacterium]